MKDHTQIWSMLLLLEHLIMSTFTTQDLISLHLYALSSNTPSRVCLDDTISMQFSAIVTKKNRFIEKTSVVTITIKQYEPGNDNRYIVDGLCNDFFIFDVSLEQEHIEMLRDLIDGKEIHYNDMFMDYTAIALQQMAA